MKVISVINYKGGVGKTTLSANIAALLANKGKDVLVVDLDPQTNLTLSFIDVDEWKVLDEQGKTVKHWYDNYLDHGGNSSLKELIISPEKVNHELTVNGEGKIDLIPSHLDLIHVDMELSSLLGGTTERTFINSFLRVVSRLKLSLMEFEDTYDVIIIDCPPNFNLVTQNAIVASDYYIVPAKPDYLSTLGISTLLRHINNLKDKYNTYVKEVDREEWITINPTNLGVIFAMVSYYKGQPISTQRDYISQIKRQREDIATFDSYLRDNKSTFGDAPERGVPVVLKRGVDPNIKEELDTLVLDIMLRARLK